MISDKRNMDYSPPRLALLFLNWFCLYNLVEEIEGDLLERFEMRKDRYLKVVNQFFFFFAVIGFFRPMFWRKKFIL